MKHLIFLTFAAFGFAQLSCGFELYPGCQGKKYIVDGWEFKHLDVSDFLRHADRLDRETPFDGIIFRIGKASVSDLSKFREHRSLRNSFASTFGNWKDGRKAWTDDAAWAKVGDDLAAVGRMLREAGLPGIHTDVEDYTGFRQFFRQPQDPSWAELVPIVRRRGRETFAKLFAAYPTITVFNFFSYSNTFFLRRFTDVRATARDVGDLWPTFLDGVYDALPPTATIIEGNENSYKYSATRHDFERARTAIFNWLMPLVPSENRCKFLTQTKLAQALFMDMYVLPEGSSWYHGPLDGSRTKHLLANAREATGSTDEYVWFWGECGRWFDWDDVANKKLHPRARNNAKWSVQLKESNLGKRLAAIKDPEAYYRPRIMAAIESGAVTNIAKCIFSEWQADPDPKAKNGRYQQKGTIQREPDGHGGIRFTLTGVARGCVHLNLKDVKTGELFFVRCRMRGLVARPGVNFMGNGQWLVDRIQMHPDDDCATDWQKAEALVEIPSGVDMASFSFGSAATSPADVAAYDRVEIYRITDAVAGF